MLLLDAQADLNQARTHEGGTALYVAVEQGHEHCVHRLLKAGAYIVKADEVELGQTPLMLAAAKGYTPIVRSLVKAKAELEERENLVTQRQAVRIAASKAEEAKQAVVDNQTTARRGPNWDDPFASDEEEDSDDESNDVREDRDGDRPTCLRAVRALPPAEQQRVFERAPRLGLALRRPRRRTDPHLGHASIASPRALARRAYKRLRASDA